MENEGRKNRRWSKEEKLRIVKRYLDEHIGSPMLARQENVAEGMLRKWVRRYLNEGEQGLENRKKPGNPFAALHTSKSMTEVERLRLTVAKQKVEIGRLKNGYRVKGGGSNKVFVISSGVNIKSSKN